MWRIFALFILFSVTANAGDLSIDPKKPIQFDTLSFSYLPDEKFSMYDDFTLLIFAFTNDKVDPVGYSIKMEKVGDTYKSQFVLPMSTVMGLVKVAATDEYYEIYDDNYNNYWSFMVYTPAGKPLEKAQLQTGLSLMGNMPEIYSRQVDFRKAKKYLENEVKDYPNNIQAQIGLTSLLLDMQKITWDDFNDDITKILDQVGEKYDINDENEIRSIVRALMTINKKQKAEQIEEAFITANPNSELAEENLLSELSEASSLDEFKKLSIKFFEDFPNSDSRENIFSAFITAYLNMNRLDELMKILKTIDDVPFLSYSQIAYEVANKRELMPDIKKSDRIDSSFAILKPILTKIKLKVKPKKNIDYYTDYNWQLKNDHTAGSILETAGKIALEGEKNSDALEYFIMAEAKLRSESTVVLYENIVEIAVELKKDSIALEYAKKAIYHSKSSNQIDEYHKNLSIKFDPSLAGKYDDNLDLLSTKAYNLRQKLLQYEDLNGKPFYSTMKTLDDRIIEATDFRDNIIVILFFSTWCGPCQAMIPAYEELFEKFEDDMNVYVIGLDVWEQDGNHKDALYEFFENNEANFVIYYDDTDIIPKQLGITGLPTVAFIDKEGKLRFKETGFTNDEEFINSSMDRIDYLMTEE